MEGGQGRKGWREGGAEIMVRQSSPPPVHLCQSREV